MLSGRKIGAVFSYALMGAQIISGLLFTPFLIRSLGQAEYGVYSLSLTITGYFTLLDLGVGNAMVRYFSKFRFEDDIEGQRRFAGLSIIFYSVVCLVMMGLLWLLRGNFESIFGNGLTASEIELAMSLLLITVANAGVTLLMSVFDKILIAYELFAVSKLVQIASIVIRVAVQAALLLAGFGSMGIVVSNLLLTIATGTITASIVILRLHITPSFRGIELGFLKEVFGYTAFVFLQMVATQVNAMADQLILGMVSSSAILGVYAVGSQINQYQQSIASGINSVTMPSLVKLVEEKLGPEAIQAEMVKVGRLCFIIAGIIMGGFFAIGDEFISLWAGVEYFEAYYVAVLLMLPMTLTLIQSSGSQVLWAMSKHQTQAIINVVVALANVGLTIALVRWNPLIGAALGSAVACVLGNIIAMNIVFRKDIGIKMRNYYFGLMRGILPSIVVSSAAGFCLKLVLPTSWLSMGIEIIAMLVVYGIALAVKGLNDYERKLVLSIVRRIPVVKRFAPSR